MVVKTLAAGYYERVHLCVTNCYWHWHWPGLCDIPPHTHLSMCISDYPSKINLGHVSKFDIITIEVHNFSLRKIYIYIYS